METEDYYSLFTTLRRGDGICKQMKKPKKDYEILQE